MTHVTYEHAPVLGGDCRRRLQNCNQITDIRKVLDHGVEQHCVECSARNGLQIRGLLLSQLDVTQLRALGGPPRQPCDGCGREIDAAISRALRGELPQDQANTAADFEHLVRPQPHHALDGGLEPLLHVIFRDRLACVAAVPADEARSVRLHRLVAIVEQLLPLIDRLRTERIDLTRLRQPQELRTRHSVGDQSTLAVHLLAHRHDRLSYPGLRQQHTLDLSQLHTMSTELDLLISAAEKFEAAVVAAPDPIAAAVHSGSGTPIRTCDEPFGRKARTTQIAARQSQARDVQLARDAWRHRLQIRLQHVDLHVGQRAADRQRVIAAGRKFRVGGAHCRFGRAVFIDETTL